MTTQLYQLLADLGYHHPLHPVLTHLPVGLTIASFLFMALGYVLRRQDFTQTACHCTVLAFLAVIPTAAMGYLDWKHFYAGAVMDPIKIKMALAGLFALLLLATVFQGTRRVRPSGSRLILHLLSLACVMGLGFYGAELVYGQKGLAASEPPPQPAVQTATVAAGAGLFRNRCSPCHFTDSTEKKIGPGLKGLFHRPAMPSSGWPMTAESIRKQLKTPFQDMPAFDSLTEEQVAALIDYLKSF